eukprot:SAG11_NODE_538_length_8664_cov_5.830590_8_plen_114_part_00
MALISAWLCDVQGGLAMSRSLGDHKLVKVGVIPDPEISRHQVRPGKDKFIVLASGESVLQCCNPATVSVINHFASARLTSLTLRCSVVGYRWGVGPHGQSEGCAASGQIYAQC